MTVFTEALDRRDPADRAAYLAAACGGDAELRRRVDELLAAHPGIGRFLEPDAPHASYAGPAGGSAAETGADRPGGGTETFGPPAADSPGRDERPGAVIAGRYVLAEPIGEGGMGSVWRADQTDPVKRPVAVKLIKAGMDSKQVLARFEAERQALALMDHPNIATVLDGGVHAGRPFFVMELVRGTPITDYCDARK